MSDQAPTLCVEDDEPGEPRQIALEGEAFVIGRDPSSDLHLRDRNISRRHAELRRDSNGRFWVRDLKSYNGSYVNGRRIGGPTRLDEGACLQVGDVILTLRGAGGQPASGPSWHGAPSSDEASHRLLVVQGPYAGRVLRLGQGPLTLGAGDHCALRFEGDAFRGFEIMVRPLADGRYEVVNRGSVPMHVGLQVTGRAPLYDSDLIWFATSGKDLLLELRYLAEGMKLPTYPGSPVPVRPPPAHPGHGVVARERRRARGRAWGGPARYAGALALAPACAFALYLGMRAAVPRPNQLATTGELQAPATGAVSAAPVEDAAQTLRAGASGEAASSAGLPSPAPTRSASSRRLPMSAQAAGRKAGAAEPSSPGGEGGEDGEQALRTRLEQRAQRGGASAAELRQLRNLCARQRDHACYDRAQALLNDVTRETP